MKTPNPAEDGTTHINVYSKGATLLGRLLSNFARTPVLLPEHGYFASIEGYWYWLQVRDDKLRHVSGWPAKKLGRSIRGSRLITTLPPDFQERIKIALRCKIQQHAALQKLLRGTPQYMPFMHYYVYNGIAVDRTQESQWMLDIFEQWRREHT